MRRRTSSAADEKSLPSATGDGGRASGDESEGDSEDFRECEDFPMGARDSMYFDCEELEPVETLNDNATSQESRWQEPERVTLKRIVLDIARCNLQVIGIHGVVGLEIARISHSSDTRCQLALEELRSLRSLFDLPEAWGESSGATTLERNIGIIYAGLSLGSLCLSCHTVGRCSEVIQIQHGLTLRHKGKGEPSLVAGCPQQLLEVELSDLTLCDSGREDVEAIVESLTVAVTQAPKSPAGVTEEVLMPICCRLEAQNVVLHVGPSIAQPTWHCSLPSVRLCNVMDDFDEVWKYTLSGLSVTRPLGDPLGGSDALTKASDSIKDLETQLAREKLKSRRHRRMLRITLIALLGGALLFAARRTLRRGRLSL